LENGLAAGYEKFVLDCEILGMLHRFIKGLDLADDALAMDSIRDVPPGGHHLGTPYTMERFSTAFYRAELFDYNDVGQWKEEGGKSAAQRGADKVEQLLSSYQAPEIDPSLDQELLAFIDQRKKEIQT
jgi:trimethylamine--corrinoid protein Co-methyltransferase